MKYIFLCIIMRNDTERAFDSSCICRTVFLLSEALDEQLKTLWFSPFQTDEIESDLEMVCALLDSFLAVYFAYHTNLTVCGR